VTEPVQIVRFQANPDRIRAGESAMLDWQVLNAESVTITNLGNVDPNGQRSVSPNQTTSYRLTARNPRGEISAVATVVVEQEPRAQFLSCTVSPANITAGETATISYATANADTVTISGIGNVDPAGNRQVTPTETTTYTLTANNVRGPVTCTVTVQVMERIQAPRIVTFAANPMTITAGQSSTLTWNVENADSVSISGIGTVASQGSQQVSPTANNTYTLTATNRGGTSQATATITVNPVEPGDPAPTLTACVAAPATSPSPGSPVVISYTATNATSISFSPSVTGATLAGPVTVNPQATTAYTITVTGTQNRTATCTVNVTVTPGAEPPTAIIIGGPVIDTLTREVILDATTSTNPAGGALTYFWEPLGTGGTVLDQGQGRTRVQLAGLFGDYQFRVTVRNAQGQEGTAIVTVRFRSTNPA
jgi:hypothetical protein